MKIISFSTASGALLAAFAYAAPPLSALDTRQFLVSVTFFGADGAQYTQNFLADNSLAKITKLNISDESGRFKLTDNDLTNPANPLSVSHISFLGGAIFSFGVVDGSVVTLAF